MDLESVVAKPIMTKPSPPAEILDDDAFRAGMDLAGIGVWKCNLSTRRVTLSPRAAELYGAPAGASIGMDRWRASIDIGDRERTASMVSTVGVDQANGSTDLMMTAADGTRRVLRETWAVSSGLGGQADHILGIVADISEERRGDERRRELIHELQHRMKGVLSLVRSLARRTATHSPTVDEFAAHFDGRLAALAQVETTLARTKDSRADLEAIVRQELVHSLGSDEAVLLDGPTVALRGKVAELVALALHELSANAIKFGALSDGGVISLTWELLPAVGPQPQRLILIWSETGAATPPVMERRGFGMSLIEQGLPYELDATVDIRFGDDGLTCQIEIPLRPRGSG